MPRFHFDFLGGDDAVRDDVGCEFETLDLAYLDAYRSMVRIGADLLLEQRDPSNQRIEITDANHTLLMTLSFDEVFRRRPRRSVDFPGTAIASQIAHNRRLGAEIRTACVEVRASLAAARATLVRAELASVRAGRDW